MKIFLFLFSAAVFALCLDAAPLKVAAYRFDPAHLLKGSYDPGFTKLTDGKTGVGSSRLITLFGPNAPKKLLKLNFKFAAPVKISHIDFHIYRAPRSYGWHHVAAYGFLDGKRMPLGQKPFRQPYATPDKKSKQEVLRLPVAYATPVTEVEIHIRGRGSYIAMSEVVFEGTAVPVKEAVIQPNPLEYLASKSSGKFSLRREKEIIVLENRHAIFAIDPRYNGGVAFAYDKLSKRNCIPGFASAPAAFMDRFHSGSAQRDFFLGVKYECKIIADTPEKKQVVVSGRGKGGNFINVQVEKLYTLEKDSSVLRVDYTITNLQANVVNLESGYWLFNGFLFQKNDSRIFPGIYGVEQIMPGIKDFYNRELSSGWFGGGSKDSGAVFVFPYELLREIYYWGHNSRQGTAECKLGVYPIPAGDTLDFSIYLAPYSHVGFPDKVNQYAAASFDLKKEYSAAPAQVTFRSRILTPGKYTLKISGGVADGNGKVKFRELKKVTLDGKNIFSVKFANPFKKGTVVFKAELLSGTAKLFFAEKQSVFGRSSGVYMLTPDGVRKPDLQARRSKLDLNFNSSDVGEAAFDFARKYAGGTPKVLAVNGQNGGIRDMVEISRRFDMKLTTNYIAGRWALSNHFNSLRESICVNELVKVLRKDFDCMIFSADVWKFFTPALKKGIMAKVAGGTGLILTAPLKYPDELKKNIISDYKFPKYKGLVCNWPVPQKYKWRAAGTSSLISGIPVDFLPDTPILPYRVKNGKNHIMAGKYPLLSEFDYGKGKVFLCAWRVTEPADNRRTDGFFLPLNNLRPPVETWKYYEYQISLMGKLIYAASGKSAAMPAGKADASVKGKKVVAVLELDSAGKVPINVEWTLRNKFSEKYAVAKQKLNMQRGKNRFTAALELPVMDGANFADVRVTDNKGAVLWWGTAAFRYSAPGKIVKTVCDTEKVYKADGKVSCSVTASGRGKTVVELWDNNGNLIERMTGSKVMMPLKNCPTKAARIVFRRMDGNRELDRRVAGIIIFGGIPRSRFSVMQGWPALSKHAHTWNYDLYIGQLKKFGVNKAGGASSYRDTPEAERAWRENDVIHGGVSSPLWTGPKQPFDPAKKEKFSMIRRPCLSSPSYQKHLKAPAASALGHAYKFGAVDVMGADESNSIVNWDGCFSIHCQRKFREFLKKEYASLAALNKSWKTSFKRWDDVIASTSEEARKLGSFASWLDHRTFNDRNLAHSLAQVVKQLKKTDPRLIYSLSGTQETNPWNAWDHYLMTPHLESLNSYAGEQTIQQRCFAAKPIQNSPWDGYDRRWESSNYRCISGLMNGISGISIFGNFIIDPAYNISPGGKRLLRALAPWINGTGEAVMRSVFKASPVAFHYTPASIKADWFIGLDKVRKDSTKGFRLLMQDSCLPYDYAAYGQLEKSGVPGSYKVLVLPLSSAMSDREIDAAAEFVRKGGTLIADLMPGFYDQHGAVRENRAKLYALFGMKKIGKARENKAPLKWGKGTFKVDHADLDSVPGSAKAMGSINGHPAIFVNRYGKGKTVYFGCSLSATFGSWDSMRYSPGTAAEAKQLHAFWKAVLKEQSITPDATVSGITDAYVAVRTIGSGSLLAVMRNPEAVLHLPRQKQNVRIDLNKKYHIYDTVNKKYIGFGKNFTYAFLPETQALFTLLPYKAEKLLCQVKHSGRKVTFDISLGAVSRKFSDHTFKVDVFDGKGKKNNSYSRIVHGTGGRGKLEFALPLNKGKSPWSAEITELLTGVRTKVTF